MTNKKKMRGEESRVQHGKKKLYNEFKKNIKNNVDEKSWSWLCRGHLKSETESLLITASRQIILKWKFRKPIKIADAIFASKIKS